MSDKKYWISWYMTRDAGPFELHTPWWVSGLRVSDDAQTICAAIVAASEIDAKQKIKNSYDNPPENLEFRFCEERSSDWSPFSGRFKRADWMIWNDVC